MSDDNKPEGSAPVVEPPAVAPHQTPKVWTDDEVKKIIDERDKAKAKARKIDEDKQKAEEAKMIEDGHLKEVLAKQTEELEQLRKFKESKAAEDTAVREAALAKLSDEDKEIAMELSTPKLLAYVEKQNKSQAPFDGKGKPKGDATDPMKAVKGESFEQYQKRIANQHWGTKR